MQQDLSYNKDNVFKKIIDREIKSEILFETSDYIVIYDIKPERKTHLLFITKIPVTNLMHLIMQDKDTIDRFYNSFNNFLKDLKNYGINSYTIVFNNGKNSGQIIFHLHVHILSHDKLCNY